MRAKLAHVQFNVEPANLAFYRDLFAFTGWKILYDADGMLGVEDADAVSLWFTPIIQPVSNHYDGPGMNHLALAAPTPAEVDAAAGFLVGRGVELLFETPRHRPEFTGSADETYYQIMFESPDRILFEIVYTGPKTT